MHSSLGIKISVPIISGVSVLSMFVLNEVLLNVFQCVEMHNINLILKYSYIICCTCYGRCVLLEDGVGWPTSSVGDVGASQCTATFRH